MQFDNADYDGLTAAGFAHIEITVIAYVLAQSAVSITSADIKEAVISKGSIIVTVIFWDNITDATVSDLAGLISAAPVSLVLNSTHTTGTASTLLMSTVSAQSAPVASAQDQNEGLGGGAIAGIVVGVLLAIALVAAVSCVLIHRRARNSTRGPSADVNAIGRRMSTSNEVGPSIIDEASSADGIRRDSIQAEEPAQRRGSSATWSETMPAPGDEPDADTHNEAPNDAPDADTHKAAPDHELAADTQNEALVEQHPPYLHNEAPGDEPAADTYDDAAGAAPFARKEFVADDDGSPRHKSVRRSNPLLVAEVAEMAE